MLGRARSVCAYRWSTHVPQAPRASPRRDTLEPSKRWIAFAPLDGAPPLRAFSRPQSSMAPAAALAGRGGRVVLARYASYSQTVKRKAFESPVVNEAWGSRIQNCAWIVSPTLIACCV